MPPRHGHLPRRERSPFVSYCGMQRQIDEGRVIPLGPDETADREMAPIDALSFRMSCDQAARRPEFLTFHLALATSAAVPSTRDSPVDKNQNVKKSLFACNDAARL